MKNPFLQIVIFVSSILVSFGFQSAALASDVLVVDGDKVLQRQDRYLPQDQTFTTPNTSDPKATVAKKSKPKKKPNQFELLVPKGQLLVGENPKPIDKKTKSKRLNLARGSQAVNGALQTARARDAITDDQLNQWTTVYNNAKITARQLGGNAKVNLDAVITNLEEIALRGLLTSTRMPALFLTVERNRHWWVMGKGLASGQRIEFEGSGLVWQYIPSQGIQIHPLANWAKANGLVLGKQKAAVKALVDELIGLAADRAGGIAWEYYFHYAGGSPPWVSGMAQGTAIQALTRTTNLLKDETYVTTAGKALGIFQTDAPNGVRVKTAKGSHYLLYSFAPKTRVINGFIQALNGLYDYANQTQNPHALALFDQGQAEALSETPSFDTGSWSLYSSAGEESDLNYHTLVRDFLGNLCNRTKHDIFCHTADKFTTYLYNPPSTKLHVASAKSGSVTALKFWLSKVSRVGVTVIRDGSPVFSTSGTFSHGMRSVNWTPSKPGTYAVKIVATDLAGNRSEQRSDIHVGA